MEEQAYSKANWREHIQVVDMVDGRTSIGHHQNLEEYFDSKRPSKERQIEAVLSNDSSTWHRSEEHENMNGKRRLSLSSKYEGVEIKRIYTSRPRYDNLGEIHTFYKTGHITQKVEDKSNPFDQRESKRIIQNRSLYDNIEAKLMCTNNFEEEARRLLEAPLTNQRRSRSMQRDRSRSNSLERTRSRYKNKERCNTIRKITNQRRKEQKDFHRIGPLGRFDHRVAMSVCMCVCMSPSHAIF